VLLIAGGRSSRSYPFRAYRGIEWVELAFPDVNMLVHVNVNVPEEVWSHALKAKFRKHGTDILLDIDRRGRKLLDRVRLRSRLRARSRAHT
jgi:hypothetical protein